MLFELFAIVASPWYQKVIMALRTRFRNKIKIFSTKRPVEEKLINCHFKRPYKLTCYQTKSNFSLFFFLHWPHFEYFFSFFIKAFVKFEKLIGLHWQAFIIIFKNGETLKTLKEIFRQKRIVSNVVLAFLDHLKQHRTPPFSKISGCAPGIRHMSSLKALFSRIYLIMKSDILKQRCSKLLV